mgnify:CR=1 FL=1
MSTIKKNKVEKNLNKSEIFESFLTSDSIKGKR